MRLIPLLTAGWLLLLLAHSACGQTGVESTSETESVHIPASTTSTKKTKDTAENTEVTTASPPVNKSAVVAKDRNFIPSETISEDLPVSFPVDI